MHPGSEGSRAFYDILSRKIIACGPTDGAANAGNRFDERQGKKFFEVDRGFIFAPANLKK
jgi:hypothetical protein